MLLPLTVAFALGLVGGSFLPYLPSCLLAVLLVVALALVGLERIGRFAVRQGTGLYGSLLIGVLYWTAFAWITAGSPLADFSGNQPVKITGRVVEPVRHRPDRMVLVLSSLQIGEGASVQSVKGRLRVTWRAPDVVVGQGDTIALTARLRPPSGTLNPGGFDYAAHLRRQGIDAVAAVAGPGQVRVVNAAKGLSPWTLWRVIDGWREQIRQAAEATLSGPALGIYLGIIIGEPGYLDVEMRDAFMATGTVHILSISGSHLGLIAFLAFFLVKRACRYMPASWLQALSRRVTVTRLAAITTVLPVTGYTLLAGAEVATVRSALMILLFLLAVWLGREERLLLALAGAGLLILLHDPRALFDISFQLSFCSVCAIALVVQRATEERAIHDMGGSGRPSCLDRGSLVQRAWTWLRLYGWIAGGVTLATVPLVAYHFNQIAWLGLIANLLVVPWAGLVLVPVGLGSAVWVLLTGQTFLPLGSFNQALLDLMADFVQLVALAPGAEWRVSSPTVPVMVLFYTLLAVVIASARGHWVRRAGLVGIVLIVGWWGWSPRAPVDGETLRVTFLDVGQGDACVIELPDGQTVLIDGGTAYESFDMGRTVVGPYLWDRGIRRLDHVIGTHPQLDHLGGLAWVLRTFEVGRYWSNGVARSEPFYQRLRTALHARGLGELLAEKGQEIVSSGPCRLTVLHPPRENHRSGLGDVGLVSPRSLNNFSVVTRLECGLQVVLFTADIETAILRDLSGRDAIAGVQVLKVPHHGARSSLDEGWIRQVRPEVAVISVGRHNPYGHPTADVLAAYEQNGVDLYRTDQQGAVWITARISSMSRQVHTARGGLLQPVEVSQSVQAMLTVEGRNLKLLRTQGDDL